MGGDSFQGTEKLTNQEYHTLVKEILQKLSGLYVRGQPYVPLPEKLIHGDIDFLMILKPEVNAKDVIDCLNIQRFKINNNHTINSVYKNKQVDFCFKKDNQEFQVTKFYKSYSGMGAHLGLFLPSKEIKLSDQGLFALGYREHIKFQFLLTKSIKTILQFYGLDYETYQKGFVTRKDLFQYLRNCCFMNEKRMLQNSEKNQSKLSKFFIQYLKQIVQVPNQNQKRLYKQPLKDTLKYFKKEQQFQNQFNNILQSFDRKQKLNKKFNSTHIMDHFNIQPKKVNKLKQQFKSKFSSHQQYLNFIENHPNQQILSKMEKDLNIVPIQAQKKQPKTYQKRLRTRKEKKQHKKQIEANKQQKKVQSEQISQQSLQKEQQNIETNTTKQNNN